MNTWNKIKEKLFPQGDSKWPPLICLPLFFLVGSAIVLLVESRPKEAGALFIVLAVLACFSITGKKNLFLAGFFLFMISVTYLFWLDWNVLWLGSLFLSLYLGYEIIGEVQAIFAKKEVNEMGLTRDVDLWKTRFETLREKIDSDKEVFETEILKQESAVKEKGAEMDSLRVLIGISHKETRRLEEIVYELKQSIGNQQDALNYRQTINKSLQTKKSIKQPISLKDLMK